MARVKYLTTSEFGLIIGVKAPAVRSAIHEARIISAKKVKGVWVVHPIKGKEEWIKNTSQSSSAKSRKQVPEHRRHLVDGDENPEAQDKNFVSIREAERRDKVFKAKLSEIKVMEQAGKLVDVDKVKKKAFELARKTRDSLMSLPPRISAELASETDPFILEGILTKEIAKALENLIKKTES